MDKYKSIIDIDITQMSYPTYDREPGYSKLVV